MKFQVFSFLLGIKKDKKRTFFFFVLKQRHFERQDVLEFLSLKIMHEKGEKKSLLFRNFP